MYACTFLSLQLSVCIFLTKWLNLYSDALYGFPERKFYNQKNDIKNIKATVCLSIYYTA